MIMKNWINILVLGLLMAGGLALTSCTKNDDNTIALIGTEYYIDDILSVIPSSVQTQFFADFDSIPKGLVPPKVEGSYVMSPKQRVSSNLDTIWPLNIIENNVWLRFSNQHNGIVKMDLNDAFETETDTVFVCGNSNTFAVYFIENKSYEIVFNGQTIHAWVKQGVIMKGQVVEDGLSDFRYATIIMESENDSNGQIEPNGIGDYFIYKDGDGIARKEDW